VGAEKKGGGELRIHFGPGQSMDDEPVGLEKARSLIFGILERKKKVSPQGRAG